jgi:anti-sigma factor ChrR (cupin superfamily)
MNGHAGPAPPCGKTGKENGTMNCAACERHLSAYIDDELTSEQRLELESHLDACDSCRAEFETHQAAWDAARSARPGAAPEGLWDAISAELDQTADGGTSLNELGLMLRGLASEVRDLRLEMADLRRAMEGGAWTEERDSEEAIRVQMRQFPGGRTRDASIGQLRRTS